MKLKSKLIAAAIALVAASGANAAIDNGAGGNGELFFNIWDANGSYTRSLETSIDSFQSQLGAVGNLNLSWAADATFTSFMASVVTPSELKWNVVATDTTGGRRILETYTAPEATTKKTNDVMRTLAAGTQTFVNDLNTKLASVDSATYAVGTVGYAGNNAKFGDKGAGLLNFSNAGTLANNSYANGLGFMRIDALATGTAASQYNEYLEGTTAVNAYLDGTTLHIAAAIPEPSEYALMLAGLGMLGFMARRRLNNRV